MKKIITFDVSAKAYILGLFGLSKDQDGYLVEKENPAQRVLSSSGEPITAKQFAGLKKGSLIVIKSDLPSLIDLSDQLESVR